MKLGLPMFTTLFCYHIFFSPRGRRNLRMSTLLVAWGLVFQSLALGLQGVDRLLNREHWQQGKLWSKCGLGSVENPQKMIIFEQAEPSKKVGQTIAQTFFLYSSTCYEWLKSAGSSSILIHPHAGFKFKTKTSTYDRKWLGRRDKIEQNMIK